MSAPSTPDLFPFTLATGQEPLLLHRAQDAFVRCDAKFCFYVGGVGAGKTFAGAVRAIRYALAYPRSLGYIGAPTYAMLRDVTERAFFDLLPAGLELSRNKTQHSLRLTNNSEVLFRSLDQPDRSRGLNLAWFWLDEAPLCTYYAWQVLKGRLRQRGIPSGAHAGWATGTPKGRDNYYRDFEQTPRPHHQLFRAATTANLHNLPPGYIEDLGYTGAFAEQEIEGQFVAFEGLVYQFDASEGGNLRAAPPDKTFDRVIGGVDWGFHNPVAAVVFGLDGDGRAWQLAEYYTRGAEIKEVAVPALLDLTRRHHVAVWHCGPDEPEHIQILDNALVHEGIDCRADRAENAVVAGLQTVTRLLARRADGTHGLYVDPACTNTIAEYAEYRYEPGERADGARRDPAERPLKHHDHALDATRYALHTELGRSARSAAYLARTQRQAALNQRRAKADEA